MAVTFDANSAADQNASAVVGTTGFTTTGGLVTVGSGTNRALVVCLNFSLPTVASVVVTWDTGGTNQAMTQIVAAPLTGGGDAQLWGLVAPTSGAKDLKVTWVGTSDIIVNGTSWTSVDQTGGATTFPHSTSGSNANSSPATVTITSAVGNATMACVTTTTSTLGGQNQTATYTENGVANEGGAGSRAAGAATVTHTFTVTLGATNNWVEVGTDILAVAAATDTQEWLPRWAPHRPIRDTNTLY